MISSETLNSKDETKQGKVYVPSTNFHFPTHKLLSCWLVSENNRFEALNKHFTFEDEHNIRIHVDAREHTPIAFDNSAYTIYWSSAKDGGYIQEVCSFTKNGLRHNINGPAVIRNTVKYKSIDVYKSAWHKTSEFRNQTLRFEYAINGYIIDVDRARHFENYRSFPWTPDKPLTDNDIAMFMLKYCR